MPGTLTSTPGYGTGVTSVDPGSIAAGQRNYVTATIPGISIGDMLRLEAPTTLNAGIVYEGFRISANGQIQIVMHNITASPIDDTARDWTYYFIDVTPVTEILGQDPR
jgi:hypothetical protein